MKKFIAMITSICLCAVAFLSTPALVSAVGNNEAAFVVEKVSGYAGDEVTVDINVNNNPGIATAKVTVTYDSDVLELKSITNGTVMEGALYQGPQYLESPFSLSWVVLENKTSDGVLATLTFAIKDSAELGDASIELTYNPKDVINLEEEPVTFAVENGSVTVNCNHVAGTWEEENPASCTEKGTEVQKCTKCGVVLNRRDTDALGHSFGKWETVTSPDCTNKGSEKRTCSVCQYTETRDIDPLGHSWESDYTIDKEATCTEDGNQSIHCSRCDAVKDSQVIPKSHKYGEWIVDKEATCTEDGSRHRVCSVCKAEETETLPAAHQFGEWETITAPTCTEKGSEQRTCSVCKEVETRDIDATGHSWETEFTIDKEPTATEDGSKSIHCKNCDAVKDVTVIPAGTTATDPTEPSSPSDSSESDVPQTGDSFPVEVLIVFFVAAGALTVLLVVNKKRVRSK